MNKEDLAWAAGIVSGEGNIGIHRPRRCITIRLTVGQSSVTDECPEMLTRLQRILKGGRVYKMRQDMRPNRRPMWQFYIHGFTNVQAAIAMLWQWLTPEKQSQAVDSLRIYHAEHK